MTKQTAKFKRNRRALRASRHPRNTGKLSIKVFKSSKHIYATLCDKNQQPITSIGSHQSAYANLKLNKLALATKVGTDLGNKIIGLKKHQESLWFDRRGFKFHGRIKAVADALRANNIPI